MSKKRIAVTPVTVAQPVASAAPATDPKASAAKKPTMTLASLAKLFREFQAKVDKALGPEGVWQGMLRRLEALENAKLAERVHALESAKLADRLVTVEDALGANTQWQDRVVIPMAEKLKALEDAKATPDPRVAELEAKIVRLEDAFRALAAAATPTANQPIVVIPAIPADEDGLFVLRKSKVISAAELAACSKVLEDGGSLDVLWAKIKWAEPVATRTLDETPPAPAAPVAQPASSAPPATPPTAPAAGRFTLPTIDKAAVKKFASDLVGKKGGTS